MWEVAQRASLRVKIEGCVDNALRGININGGKLDDCLAKVQQNIVTVWNFEDKEKILTGGEFKQLMLCLVQGVQEPPNRDGSHTKADTASASLMAAIGLTNPFKEWLSNAVLNNEPPAQRVLLAYNADIITVLKLLFENATQTSPLGPPRATGPVLNEVYQAYKLSDTRREIYRRISEKTQQDLILGPELFRSSLYELLGYGPVSPPSGRAATSSSVGSGVASSSHPTRMPTLSPPIEVAASSHHSARIPPPSPQEPAPPPQNPSPPVWSCLFPCLSHPSQRP